MIDTNRSGDTELISTLTKIHTIIISGEYGYSSKSPIYLLNANLSFFRSIYLPTITYVFTHLYKYISLQWELECKCIRILKRGLLYVLFNLQNLFALWLS